MSVVYYPALFVFTLFFSKNYSDGNHRLAYKILALMGLGLLIFSYDLTVTWQSGSTFGQGFFVLVFCLPLSFVGAMVLIVAALVRGEHTDFLISGLITLIAFSLLPLALGNVFWAGCTELNRLEARPLIDATALYRADHQGDYPDTYFVLLDDGYIQREPIAFCASFPARNMIEHRGFHFEIERDGNVYLALPYISAGGTTRYDFEQGSW